jgi:Eukaryotic cytochrome b561
MIDWLLAPLSGSSTHHIAQALAWHGRCMVLAWGVLVPAGILIARFWKIWPGQKWPQELDNKVWWNIHRFGQTIALVIMTAGAYLAWQADGHLGINKNAANIHAMVGWLLVSIGWLQVLGGLLRGTKGGPTEPNPRGDHYDMTKRRRIFETAHKTLGWASLVFAVFAITVGLVMVDAPRWMLLLIIAWWLALAGLAWRWQKQGKCINTYHAIWGPTITSNRFTH